MTKPAPQWDGPLLCVTIGHASLDRVRNGSLKRDVSPLGFPLTLFPLVTAMFGARDYLYCDHVSCGRKFCSERSFEKHCLGFHGRPTCDLCGLKLKKSSKVNDPLPMTRVSNPTDVLRVYSIDVLSLTVILRTIRLSISYLVQTWIIRMNAGL